MPRTLAIQLHEHTPPWRTRALQSITAATCDPSTADDARAALREVAAEHQAHAVISVRCYQQPGGPGLCWTSHRCDGMAVRWMPNQ